MCTAAWHSFFELEAVVDGLGLRVLHSATMLQCYSASVLQLQVSLTSFLFINFSSSFSFPFYQLKPRLLLIRVFDDLPFFVLVATYTRCCPFFAFCDGCWLFPFFTGIRINGMRIQVSVVVLTYVFPILLISKNDFLLIWMKLH